MKTGDKVSKKDRKHCTFATKNKRVNIRTCMVDWMRLMQIDNLINKNVIFWSISRYSPQRSLSTTSWMPGSPSATWTAARRGRASVPTTKLGWRGMDRGTPPGQTPHLQAVTPPASPAPVPPVRTHSHSTPYSVSCWIIVPSFLKSSSFSVSAQL